MDSSPVVQEIFAVLRGEAAPVITRWTYDPADPFAVALAVHTRGDRWVEWAMSRDLVLAGLTHHVGAGDIRLHPFQVHGYDVVVVEIDTIDGQAVLEVDLDLLEAFVLLTIQAVEPGTETLDIDMDAELAKII